MSAAPTDSDLKQTPVTDVPLVFLDVETTGLWPERGDRICEICLIRRDPDGTLTEWATLVDPQRPISSGAFAVNRITPEMLIGAPLFAEVVASVDALSVGAVWVAHNAPFDLGFLRAEYAHLGRSFSAGVVIDTVELARRHFHFASNRLGALAREFGVATPSAHRARGDCRTMRAVFDAILRAVYPSAVPAVGALAAASAARVAPGSPPWERLPASLTEMIAANRELNISYVDASGHTTTRPIRVREVTQLGEHVYLVATCGMRQDERHFRLDRIIDWRPVPPEASP
jgi:DNA polymerase-3 subunit epsilon